MAFGDQAKSSGGSETAKGLLTQIKGLLHQYIDLGDSTPLAGEAKTFLADVEDGLNRLDSEPQPPDEGGAGSEPEASPPSDFRGAKEAAAEAMRNGTLLGNSGGTKAEEEQSPGEEEEPKKRTKA